MAFPDIDNGDILTLPADTLGLLNEFLAERDHKAKQFGNLQAQAANDFACKDGKLSMDVFGEDWQASQFWYTDDTAKILANALLEGASNQSSIAIVSAPSVYIALRNLLLDQAPEERPLVKLLEYDQRFEVLGPDFVHYDFQLPLKLPPDLKGKFDRIICDPPFLSDECQTKTALTVRYLAKEWAPLLRLDDEDDHDHESLSGLRFISCSGERMEDTICRLYANIGVQTTNFEPKHSKGLSNEFRCYANFEWEG